MPLSGIHIEVLMMCLQNLFGYCVEFSNPFVPHPDLSTTDRPHDVFPRQ